MLGVVLFNSPVPVLEGIARKEIIVSSSALKKEQLGQRGHIKLGDIIPLCPKSSEKEAEARARALSPDREEVGDGTPSLGLE